MLHMNIKDYTRILKDWCTLPLDVYLSRKMGGGWEQAAPLPLFYHVRFFPNCLYLFIRGVYLEEKKKLASIMVGLSQTYLYIAIQLVLGPWSIWICGYVGMQSGEEQSRGSCVLATRIYYLGVKQVGRQVLTGWGYS